MSLARDCMPMGTVTSECSDADRSHPFCAAEGTLLNIPGYLAELAAISLDLRDLASLRDSTFTPVVSLIIEDYPVSV
ncbi:hypothetical protein BBBOND_0211450 [Babesia bigemina]|uniref:Uncharacterized protein n=1 Tax=Babesia bigemina TaxID=5866 RepID=A0A061DD68_BABBI|nr:hypothetical protein BBBOND_0211450 [Babesia bigemina]CDR96000.1 hypothetical protein BBBOND_0211450 [Babesia bigemina]|eukprot:XP_012768186.1 hypothetical protein BBBOND_0211450 [Babesia bigemina]